MTKRVKVSGEDETVDNDDLHPDVAIDPVPVSLDEIGKIDSHNDKDGGDCFACHYRLDQSVDRHKDKRLYALKQVVETHKGKMSTTEYYKLISEQHYIHLVKPFEGQPGCPARWTPSSVKLHFESHIEDARSMLEGQLRVLKVLINEQSKTLFVQHPSKNHTEPDQVALESYRKSLREQRETIKVMATMGKLT
jgi:hypothetical protein